MDVAIKELEKCIRRDRNLIMYSNNTVTLSGKYLSEEEKEERRVFVEKCKSDISSFELAIEILIRENK